MLDSILREVILADTPMGVRPLPPLFFFPVWDIFKLISDFVIYDFFVALKEGWSFG